MLHKMFTGVGLNPLPGDQGGYDGVLVFGKALFAELLQSGVGGGLLPAQFLGAKLHQAAGG